MANQKIPPNSDRLSPQGLPAQSGIIDRELYDSIHKEVTEKGKREGSIFSLETDETLWAASTTDDEMGLIALGEKSKICKFFFPPEGFDLDVLAEATRSNIFMFLKGHVPYEFHDEVSDEIDAQADLLPDDKKKDVMSHALGELRIARKFSEAVEGMIAEAAEGGAE
jgi:hypothetical protein